MGHLRHFANACKRHWGKLTGAALMLLGGMIFVPATPAQYIGNVGQASTVNPISVGASHAQTILPACSGNQTLNCIKMIGQVGHLLTINYPAGDLCLVWLDGSFDGMSYTTIAQALLIPGTNSPQQLTTANGYYPLLRLKVNPAGAFNCSALTGTYSGFQTPLPITNLAVQHHVAVSTIAAVGYGVDGVYYLWQGIECSNPNASTAYLQLYDAVVTPTLGTGYIYEIGIGAGQTWNFPTGLSLLGIYEPWAGAATAAGGSTAVSTALDCNFQHNYWGPFAPLNPVSP